MIAGSTPLRAGTLYLMHELTHATRSRLDGLLLPFGLTSFHYTVLSVIGRDDGLSSSRLSRRFYVTPQAMGEVILLLEKRGFVVRSENPTNRKVLHLALTTQAREALAAADPKVADFERGVFVDVAGDDLQALRQTMAAALARLRQD